MTWRKGDVFIPNGDSRRETAILLLGTAEENHLPPEDIHADPHGGFWITDDLADILYDEGVIEEPEDPAPNKTSGSRAAKKNSQKEE